MCVCVCVCVGGVLTRCRLLDITAPVILGVPETLEARLAAHARPARVFALRKHTQQRHETHATAPPLTPLSRTRHSRVLPGCLVKRNAHDSQHNACNESARYLGIDIRVAVVVVFLTPLQYVGFLTPLNHLHWAAEQSVEQSRSVDLRCWKCLETAAGAAGARLGALAVVAAASTLFEVCRGVGVLWACTRQTEQCRVAE